MSLDYREVWTIIHGTVFGVIFLLGSSGAIYALHSLQINWQTEQGLERERQEYPDLPVGLDGMRLGSRVNRDVYHLSLVPCGPSGGRV